jgi:hypothetical protein
VADRHLRKAHLPRQGGDGAFVFGMPIGVHEHDGDRRDAVAECGVEVATHDREIGRALHRAVGAYALVHFDDTLEQHVGLDDVAGEDLRPRLVADPERVAETRRGQEERALALALEQRVGGDGGPHLDGRDRRRRDRFASRDSEEVADALHGGVRIGLRIVGQKLVGDQRAVRPAADHVRERAAAIDPERPLTRHAGPPSDTALKHMRAGRRGEFGRTDAPCRAGATGGRDQRRSATDFALVIFAGDAIASLSNTPAKWSASGLQPYFRLLVRSHM